MPMKIKSKSGRAEVDTSVLYTLHEKGHLCYSCWIRSLELALEFAGIDWTISLIPQERPQQGSLEQANWDAAQADARMIMLATITEDSARYFVLEAKTAKEALARFFDMCPSTDSASGSVTEQDDETGTSEEGMASSFPGSF